MSNSKYPTLAMPDAQKLTASSGHGGFLVWRKALRLLIISFGHVADEFLTGHSNPPVEPGEDDRRPAKSSVRPVPTTALPTPAHINFDADVHPHTPPAGAVAEDLDDDPPFLPEPPVAPRPFIFQHDEAGTLTPAGYASYDAAVAAYRAQHETYTEKHNHLFSYILTTLNPSALSLLHDQSTFDAVITSKNAVQLHDLLIAAYTSVPVIQSLVTLKVLTKIKRLPNQTGPEFNQQLRICIQNFTAAFQDPDLPGHVKINALHVAFLLQCQPPEYAPFIDNLLLIEPKLLSLPVDVIEGKLRAHGENQFALGRHLTGFPKPALFPNPSFKGPPRPHNDPNNALATPYQPKISHWTPQFPHSAPRNTGKPTGDANQPHCGHCALNGYIRNNHGNPSHPTPCFDLKRLSELPSPPQPRPDQSALITQLMSALTHSENTRQADALATLLAADDTYTLDHDSLHRLATAAGPVDTRTA